MLSGLVGFLAICIPLFLSGLLGGVIGSKGVAIFGLLGFLLAVVGVNLALGSYAVIAGRSAREETVTIGESYRIAFKRFFGSLLLTVIVLLLIIVGTVLLILPGIYFMARASLAYFVLYEENLGAIAALKRSFALTKGHSIEMLGAVVASAFLGGGSGLLSGAISLSPLVGRYHDLKNLQASGAPKPKVHYLNWLILIVAVLFVGGYFGFIAYTFHKAGSSLNSLDSTNFNSLDSTSYPTDSTFSN